MCDTDDAVKLYLPLGLLSLGLVGCTGSFVPVQSQDADAGPDQAARLDFDTNVKPIMDTACFTCHTSGAGGAPLFSDYDTVVAYSSANGKLVDCTTATSLLYTKGSHAAGQAPAFDAATQAPKVQHFIETWAMVTAACQSAASAATGSIAFQQGANTVALSTLGPGLDGAQITFSADVVGTGLYLSAMQVTAGANGLHITHPRFETCPGGTKTPANDSFAAVDQTLGPGETQTFGPGTFTLLDTAIGQKFGLRFETITPQAGSQGAPVDNGGACAP
jgi:hypothetical protein